MNFLVMVILICTGTFPRRLTEETPKHPVWWTPREVMYADDAKPNDETLEILKKKLLNELNRLTKGKR